jgi:secondary thiamine-phosphate synthase enzyme
MSDALDRLAPESARYRHADEGPDDMPSHVKCSLLGASVTIPITDGRLRLGTWQGVWFCEFRNVAGGRKVVATIFGEEA